MAYVRGNSRPAEWPICLQPNETHRPFFLMCVAKIEWPALPKLLRMWQFDASRGHYRYAWRIVTLAVALCLAFSGTGTQLARSIGTFSGATFFEEQLGAETEVRRVLRPCTDAFKWAGATTPRLRTRLAAVSRGRNRHTPYPVPVARPCLVGAGIRLLC